MPKLDDKSPMPFGKFARAKMEDVPASYLIWLRDSMIENSQQVQVFRYIEQNLKVLEEEAEDEKPKRD